MKTKTDRLEAGTNGHAEAAVPPAGGGAPALVMREVHSLLADIEDLIKATTSLTGEDLAQAKAKLAERIASLRKSVENAGGAAVRGARQGAAVTDDYVRENPWQAVGIGAAGGLLLGLLLARRG